MITSKVLTSIGVKHFIVVEPQQMKDYEQSICKMKLLATQLELDMSFKEKYELCDSLGLSRSTGSGPARNFAWEHSIKNGFDRHWIMDDNIRSFRRLNANEKVKVNNGAIFKAMEDFVLRYKNVAMAGPNYYMFAPARAKIPPFVINTRIYSCNLIRNDVSFRWRGRYNEDTILSLDMLKAKWCTILFNAFLQEKMQTQSLPGGNTQELYHAVQTADDNIKHNSKYALGGTIKKSQMLVDVHPDCSEMKFKFQRWHHHVDYTRFKKQKLIRRDDIEIPLEPNEYGMKLKQIDKG
jgi:hypothetical protein